MKKHYDLLLVCGVLLVAGALYCMMRPGRYGAWAVVTVDGTEIGRYPLSQDRTITLGENDYNVLQIKDGAAAVTEANCGDHTCIHTGAIRREGEIIVCLPHRLIISVEGGAAADVDAAAG